MANRHEADAGVNLERPKIREGCLTWRCD